MDDWRPSASRDALEARAALLAEIRGFFAERRVLEVETPLLAQAPVTDPRTRVFQSHGRYLQTSPEYAMKRLLAAGSGAIFQICKAFRREQAGGRHNPEFTMLEWYRPGFSLPRLLDEVRELLARVLGPLACRRLTYRELFQRHVGVDPLAAPLATLREAIAGATELAFRPADRETCLDLLLTHVIEPLLARQDVVMVCGYPPSQAALARLSADGGVAERCEVYVRGVELANAYAELLDAGEQAARFHADLQGLSASGQPARPVDGRLLAALRHGLPDCAGVALGLDRLLMLKTGRRTIGEVLSFDWQRA